MVKIIIENLRQKEVTTTSGTRVITAIHASGTDWMHACGTKGRCTTCKMEVLEGMENLSALSPPENKYRQQGLLTLKERLACQTTVTGNLRIRVPDESKLPHLTYSD